MDAWSRLSELLDTWSRLSERASRVWPGLSVVGIRRLVTLVTVISGIRRLVPLVLTVISGSRRLVTVIFGIRRLVTVMISGIPHCI